MNDTLIDLGFVSIKWYSALMLIALLVGIFIVNKEAKKFKIDDGFVTNLIFWTIIIGIIGARMYYVAFEWEYYSTHLSEIIKIWEGGIAIHGAILFGALFIILYTKKYKIHTLRITDIIVPALCIGQAIGRWGNFFNGEAHGPVTTLSYLQNLHLPEFIINGMYINGVYYQPTFLYEFIWDLAGFIILIILRRHKYTKIGSLTSIYLIWYSIGRFFIEGLRTDSLMLGNFKMAQLVSMGLFIIGIIIFIVCHKGPKLNNLYNEKEESNIKF